jgi:hypothetical protein
MRVALNELQGVFSLRACLVGEKNIIRELVPTVSKKYPSWEEQEALPSRVICQGPQHETRRYSHVRDALHLVNGAIQTIG